MLVVHAPLTRRRCYERDFYGDTITFSSSLAVSSPGLSSGSYKDVKSKRQYLIGGGRRRGRLRMCRIKIPVRFGAVNRGAVSGSLGSLKFAEADCDGLEF